MAAQRKRRKVTWPAMNKDDIPLRNVIGEYLQYHDGLNHSPKTVRWYSDILFALNAFLGRKAHLADLTVPRMRAYQSHLRSRRLDDGRSLSDESLHDHARGIRTFLSWLHREGYLEEREASPQPTCSHRCQFVGSRVRATCDNHRAEE